MEAWKELGVEEVDYNSGNQVGVGKFQYTMKNGARQSTNAAFIRPIRDKRSNLVVRPNCQVIKVILNDENKAIGVEYLDKNTKERKKALAKKEVIVSAGSYDSPKLLMLSGIGPAEELQKNNIKLVKELKVGRNLHDHVATSLVTLLINDPSAMFTDVEKKKEDLNKWKNTHDNSLTASGLWGLGHYAQSSREKRPGVPDIMFHYITMVNVLDLNMTHYIATSYYNSIVVQPTILVQKSRGWIELNKTDPIFSNALVYPNFWTHPDDMEILMEAIEISDKLRDSKVIKRSNFTVIQTPAPACLLKGLFQHLTKSSRRKYYECLAKKYYSTIYVPAGTCKMGPENDPDAVVNPRLQVYGIENLRVIDSSIIPTSFTGNNLAAAMMIGEKGSDMIKEDWLTGSYQSN